MPEFYDFGNYRLDIANRELLLAGRHLALTQKCFEILLYLIENRDRVVKKEEILSAVWAENFVEEANLAQHIYMIRKVFKEEWGEETPLENPIETVPKHGYRFVFEVEEISEAKLAGDRLIYQTETGFGIFPHDVVSPQTGGGRLPEKDLIKDPSIPPSPRKGLNLFSAASVALLFLVLFSFTGYKFYGSYAEPPENSDFESLAILPFQQIGETENEKLGLGIADTLISKLSSQKDFSVSPTSSIIRYIDRTDLSPVEIGEKLNADFVLTGTIQRDRENVRVNVQLIDVRRKSSRWSDKFDADFADMFALQDKIYEQVASRLSIKSNKFSETIAEFNHTENFEAYQAYTMGLFHWDKRTDESLLRAADYFEKAIEKDSRYALARALLADTYSLLAFVNPNNSRKERYIEKAKKEGSRALALNPKSSEAVTALALIALYEKKPERAFYLYRKAIEINPHNATARQRYAWMLTYKNDLEEAIEEMKFAQKAQPHSHLLNANLAYFLYLDKKPEEALRFCQRAIEIAPALPENRIMLAKIYEQMGAHEKAIRELEKTSREAKFKKESLTILSRIHAKKGDKTKALKTLEEASKKPDEADLDYETATAYLYLGNKNQAVKILTDANEENLEILAKVAHDYNLDPFRVLPEFDRIISKIQNRQPEDKDGKVKKDEKDKKDGKVKKDRKDGKDREDKDA